MKSFRRLLSATVVSCVVMCRNNIRWKVASLKYVKDLGEGLLVKSVQCKVSGQQDDDSIVKRVTKWHCPRRISLSEKKCKPVWTAASMTKEESLYIFVETVMVF